MSIKTGVIGHPIGHSKSPIIHNYWMTRHDIKGDYKAIDITPDDLNACLKALVDDGYAGLNVTIPHKIAIMDMCDTLDDTARAIGAVNTLHFTDGQIMGHNTDAYGFIQNMHETHTSISFDDTAALVIGAGGAAKAAVYALITAGVGQIYIANRTQTKAQELIQEFQIYDHILKAVPWDDMSAVLPTADFIINTTSLGMAKNDDLIIDFSAVKPSAIAYDIVYAPLMTQFLHDAQNADIRIVTGIGMLIHQARKAFEIWHNVLPDVNETLIQKVLA